METRLDAGLIQEVLYKHIVSCFVCIYEFPVFCKYSLISGIHQYFFLFLNSSLVREHFLEWSSAYLEVQHMQHSANICFKF